MADLEMRKTFSSPVYNVVHILRLADFHCFMIIFVFIPLCFHFQSFREGEAQSHPKFSSAENSKGRNDASG